MKKRLLLVFAATSLFATASFASSVFMLQFGSFETEAEAQTKLKDVATKHNAVLGGLRTSIRTISLPPDNLTVYRTQAGPIPTREQAQAACSQFASTGDECYVVETAMVDQGTPVGTQPSNTPAMAAASMPPSPPPPAPVAMAPTPSALQVSIPARDQQNAAAIASVTQAPSAPVPMVVSSPAPPPSSSSSMETALANAAAQQQTAIAPTPQPKQQVSTLHSIWWHLDPFEDEGTNASMARAPAAAPTPAARTVTVQAAASPPNPFVVDPTAPPPARVLVQQPAAPPPPAPRLSPLPSTAPVTAATPAPMAPMTITAPVPAMAMQLPPPPAPLRAEDRAALAAGQVPPPSPMMPQPTGTLQPLQPVAIARAPAPNPMLLDPTAPPPPRVVVAPFKASPSVPPGGGEPVAGGGPGNVRVGEAQRVPLSTQPISVSVPPPIASVPGPAGAPMAQQPYVSLHPSSTLGEKTLWAQIGRFADAQSALAFWEAYRQAHPDFPVVRVRVTAPYQLQQRGVGDVSLRVGPFASQGFIHSLCATIPSESSLRCGVVGDLGVAADPSGKLGYLPDSRYHRTVEGMR